MTKRNRRPKLALVLGSGGIKCAAAIGVMQVLEAENIDVDMVVGCSGGAVYGAAIALGFSSNQLIETSEQAWTSDVTRRISISSLLKIIFPKIFRFDDYIGVIDDRIMAGNIEKVFGIKTTFGDTQIPFYCVATDFNTGEPVVISKGKLARAVRISSGIPIVFKPLEWEGRLLIDGALSNPLPIDVAIKAGADLIIALGFEPPLQHSVSSPVSFASQMFSILENQLLVKKFAFYNLAYHSEIIAIVPEFKDTIKVNDVSKVPFIVEQGRRETEKHIQYLKQSLTHKSNRENLP
jgi:NTE family protein